MFIQSKSMYGTCTYIDPLISSWVKLPCISSTFVGIPTIPNPPNPIRLVFFQSGKAGAAASLRVAGAEQGPAPHCFGQAMEQVRALRPWRTRWIVPKGVKRPPDRRLNPTDTSASAIKAEDPSLAHCLLAGPRCFQSSLQLEGRLILTVMQDGRLVRAPNLVLHRASPTPQRHRTTTRVAPSQHQKPRGGERRFRRRGIPQVYFIESKWDEWPGRPLVRQGDTG